MPNVAGETQQITDQGGSGYWSLFKKRTMRVFYPYTFSHTLLCSSCAPLVSPSLLAQEGLYRTGLVLSMLFLILTHLSCFLSRSPGISLLWSSYSPLISRIIPHFQDLPSIKYLPFQEHLLFKNSLYRSPLQLNSFPQFKDLCAEALHLIRLLISGFILHFFINLRICDRLVFV